MAVMEAESTQDLNKNGIFEPEERCTTLAVGDTWVIGGLYAPSCGLFQVRTLEGRPSCDELKDPKTNIEWAWKLYNSPRGWTHWSVFNNGVYKQYL